MPTSPPTEGSADLDCRGRILLVAEDEELLGQAERKLEELSFMVASTSEPGEAAGMLSFLSKRDLVIVDLEMTQMSGWDFLWSIRAVPGERIPVLALTLRNANLDAVGALAARKIAERTSGLPVARFSREPVLLAG